jgi:hypothetical protein
MVMGTPMFFNPELPRVQFAFKKTVGKFLAIFDFFLYYLVT